MVNYFSQSNKSFNRTLLGSSKNDTYYFINDWGTYLIVSSSGLNELNLSDVLVPLTINLTSSSGHEVIDSLGNTINWSNNTISNVYAGSGNDLIYGNIANNFLSGGAGNDSIYGGAGNDTLNGGLGDDLLDCGIGNDSYVFANAWGSDILSDAGGIDTLNFSASTTALTVVLIASQLAEITDGINTLNFSSLIENFIGGTASDSISGNTAANRLEGGSGNDTIDGGLGNDTLVGGLNDDTYIFSGSFGRDTIIENLYQGNDTVDISGASGSASINLTSNATTNNIIVGTNTVKWANSEIENIISGSGSDTIRGSSWANQIDAGGGNDTVYGAAGNDSVLGGSGNDLLFGQTGDDTINGGSGDDILNGDMGRDTYQFSNNWGSDTIQDMVYDKVYTDNTIDFTSSTNAVTVKLTGSILYDEVTDGLGNKVNWSTGNVISRVIGSQGNDTFTGNLFNNFFDGHTGDDLFNNFLGKFGTDTIQDAGGEDTLNLTQYYHYASGASDAKITFSGTDLIIDIANTVSSISGNGKIIIKDYFSDTTHTAPGANFIEHILFANKTYSPFGPVNSAPTNISGTLSSVAENSVNGTSLGILTGSDPDAGNTLTYSLTDAAGRFAINSSTGEITITDSTLLDYELATSHNITVRVTDEDGLFLDKIFTVQVTDVLETPTAINDSYIIFGSSANTINPLTNDLLGNSIAANGSISIQSIASTTPANITTNLDGTVSYQTLSSPPSLNNLTIGSESWSWTTYSSMNTMSSDGRFVVFTSEGSNFITADNNNRSDIFVLDQQTSTIERISNGLGGINPNNWSDNASISLNGRYVVFQSNASNLVSNDTNGQTDIFLYDRETGLTERVAKGLNDSETNGGSYNASISNDGRFITFQSYASNIIANDTNNNADIFLFDRETGSTSLINSMAPGYTPPIYDGIYSGNISWNNWNYLRWGYFQDIITTVGAGESIQITQNGSFFNDYIQLVNKSTNQIITYDDNSQGTGSLLNWVNNTGNSLEVIIRATSSSGWDTGAFTITAVNPNTNTNYQLQQPLLPPIGNNPVISSNGKYIVYESSSGIITSGDTNGFLDAFLYNIETGTNTLISKAHDGSQANGASYNTFISADGRYITFTSSANNLVQNDTNNEDDIFVYDTLNNTIERVNLNSAGEEANGFSDYSSISADGRYVIFTSYASNLVANDTNNDGDIFAYDRQTKTIQQISSSLLGEGGNDYSDNALVSADGKHVLFTSYSNNLVANDTNGQSNVFLYKFGSNEPSPLEYTVVDANGATSSATINIRTLTADLAIDAQSVGSAGNIEITGTGNQILQYSLTNYAGNSNFSINPVTGEITLLNPLAFGTYTIEVKVDETGGNQQSGTQFFDVEVKGRAPDTISGSILSSIEENSANGTLIGTITANDLDLIDGDTITYSLASNPNNIFAIDSTTGVITIGSNTSLNYEGLQTANFTVKATDSTGLYTTKSYSIAVTNVNETPYYSSAAGFYLPEHATNETSAAQVFGGDPDAGDSVIYSLINDAGGRFQINSSTGMITVKNSTLLDYETSSAYEVTIRITDSSGLYTDGQYSISVWPVEEAPVTKNDTLFVFDLSPITFSPTTNDFDPEGGSIYLTSANKPSNAQITNNGDGTLTYTIVDTVKTSSFTTVGNWHSYDPFLSDNGRYVVFTTNANNIIPGDTNNASDVVVYDIETSTFELISQSTGGTPSNSNSIATSISADGRYITFQSSATNLVSGANPTTNVFLRDTLTDTTTLVNVTNTGTPGIYSAGGAKISGDGKYVAFISSEGSLVNETSLNLGGYANVILRNLETGTNILVSKPSGGGLANSYSDAVDISYDGRYVAYASAANNLVPGEVYTSFTSDIFVYDSVSGATERISVSSSGIVGNLASLKPSISDDGRYVVFQSDAYNLVENDTNGTTDIFLYDRELDTIKRVSVDSNGNQANSTSNNASISADGKFITYFSWANNLVTGDTNGAIDAFLYNVSTSTVERVNINSNDTEMYNGFSVGGPFSSVISSVSSTNSGVNVVFSTNSPLIPTDYNYMYDIGIRSYTDAHTAPDTFTYTVRDNSYQYSTGTVNVKVIGGDFATQVSASTGFSILTSSDLKVSASGSPDPSTFIFNISNLSSNLSLQEFNTNTNSWEASDNIFNQAQINAQHVRVFNDGSAPLGLFDFSVSDGTTTSTTKSFNVFSSDFTFDINNVLETNVPGSLNEGSSSTILNTNLKSYNSEISSSSLVYTITSDTVNGEVQLNGVNLNKGSKFTQADIDQGKVTYAHNSSETVNDLFKFTVSYGNLVSDESTFSININPVNDAPTNINLSLIYSSVPENAPNGFVVGNSSTSDPDSNSFTYQIINNLDGAFAINSTTGQITVADNSFLDYETSPTYKITVRSTDSEGLFIDKEFVINLSPYNAPPVINQESIIVVSGSPILITDPVSDPEGSIVTYTITPTTNGTTTNIGSNDLVYTYDNISHTNLTLGGTDDSILSFSDVRNNVSGDGKYVVFQSRANNLVPNDPTTINNGQYDIFLYNTEQDTIEVIAANSDNTSISADGKFMTYAKYRSGGWDVYAYDIANKTVEPINYNYQGTLIGAGGSTPINSAISNDGRFIAYDSDRWDVVNTSFNNTIDVFLYDNLTNTVQGVSTLRANNSYAELNDISDDGRYVAFTSHTGNLFDGAVNTAKGDVFVFDRIANSLEAISSTSNLTLAREATISGDGRYVAYYTSTSYSISQYTNTRNFNGYGEITLYDRDTDTSEVLTYNGNTIIGTSVNLSTDGRYIGFASSQNLLPGVSAGNYFYILDTETGSLEITNQSSNGSPYGLLNGTSMSADGQNVAFTHYSGNISNHDPIIFASKADTQSFIPDTITYEAKDAAGMITSGTIQVRVFSGDGHFVINESGSYILASSDLNISSSQVLPASSYVYNTSNILSNIQIQEWDSLTSSWASSNGSFTQQQVNDSQVRVLHSDVFGVAHSQFGFTISDGSTVSSVAVVNINVNLLNDVINPLGGTTGNDLFNSTSANENIQLGQGNDFYIFRGSNFGQDSIIDSAGSNDAVDLSDFSSSAASWLGIDLNNDTFIDSLLIDFGSGNSITVQNYFDNLSTNPLLAGAGSGYIENIMLADHTSADINTIHSLIA